jgi:exodeoxyribonuclease V alpha subunit
MVASSYHFQRLKTELAMAEVWRPLDRAIVRWVISHQGSRLLAEVAAWASFAEGQGDSALKLETDGIGRHGMRALDAGELEQLRQDALVGIAGVPGADGVDTPFVIDRDLFYLRRNYLHEIAVARHVAERRNSAAIAKAVSEPTLDLLFHGDVRDEVQAQREAVARVPGRRLFVLTGGPGTGKTTTVLRMLLMLIRERSERGQQAPLIRIAAPTGKAAQRLSESLREGAERLRGDSALALADEWSEPIESALAAQAATLHRLLGSRGSGGFSHHADNPLAADIVVIDEASMVDLTLLHVVLDALREDAVLILVGDADQLTSVGTGSVLLDLVSAMEAEGADDLVRLHHSFRADQSLVAINEAIRAGDRAAFDLAWHNAGARVEQVEVSTPSSLHGALSRWLDRLQQSLCDVGAFAPIAVADQAAILAALDQLRGHQLLCALREGEFGAEAANGLLERSLSRSQDDYADATWYPGRAVMITRNDYSAGLFNGDVGLCLLDENGHLRVWFEVTVREDDVGAVAGATAQASQRRAIDFEPGNLPEHRGAFAMTIHKSQGSEYGRVAVLLPADAGNRILSRQLLYTGVSRAKHGIELWSSEAAVTAALNTPVRRAGGMAARFSGNSAY